MEKAEKKDLGEVLSAIRQMVRDETRGKFEPSKGGTTLKSTNSAAKPKPAVNLPAKTLILKPHMRVDVRRPKVMVLEQSARVRSSTSQNTDYSVESPSIYEGMLREIVREVVQEQLRGEIGTEIINAIKRDMIQAIEKKPLS